MTRGDLGKIILDALLNKTMSNFQADTPFCTAYIHSCFGSTHRDATKSTLYLSPPSFSYCKLKPLFPTPAYADCLHIMHVASIVYYNEARHRCFDSDKIIVQAWADISDYSVLACIVYIHLYIIKRHWSVSNQFKNTFPYLKEAIDLHLRFEFIDP